MVFWITYPLLNLTYSLYPSKKFISYPFEKENVKLEEELECKEIKSSAPFSLLSNISYFLKTYFGNPPLKPILDIPPNILLSTSDILFVIYHKISKKILGTIRYHFIGNLISSENEEIYVVDCFCIHPDWRKKGLGDYLLTHLHYYANQNHIPNAMFLKEGSILSIINLPLYTSTYVYRLLNKYNYSKNIYTITNEEANKMIKSYHHIYPDIFIIYNKNTINQKWKMYKKDYNIILVCFQDTYQRVEEDGKYKKIGWITAWLESSIVNSTIREKAAEELSNSVANDFDYLWINQKWIGSSSLWKVDGSFYWYTYQWNTNIKIRESYSIMS